MDIMGHFLFEWHGTARGPTEFKTDAVVLEQEPSVLHP